ncbi:MAG TPA: type IV toxin-antitoxin system AbiEi family antitoxin domain-containing protein [Anaerolineales bacterium]|nr:type IV toxin-antitoxin system AbiEi family antitoxin domain-containing protein [Anaerolineales bacterium]
MDVKSKSGPLANIRGLLKKQNGILSASDLSHSGIPRTYLAILEKNGEIQRISRGIYVTAGNMPDEMAMLQRRFRGAIFSHETALYLLDLMDRTPLFYSVTVPSGFNATTLKASGAKVYFVQRNLYPLGLTARKSPYGNSIQTFNMERTICDVVRSRNQMDVQFVNQALKKYVEQRGGNLNQLWDYAAQFRIQKIMREYIEVLL